MKFIHYFWKTIIWFIIVLFLSISPGNSLPHPSWLIFPHIDKAVHFMMYFIFALALIHDFQQYKKIRLQNSQVILISVLMVVCIGGFLEILQRTPGINRSCDLLDFTSNAIGAVAASVSYGIFEPFLDKLNDLTK